MTSTGLGLALIASSFAFGFRHGVDWDHLAAITDITSSQRSVRKGLRLATLYAAGHGAVVFAIGVVVILAGRNIPDGVDAAMGRIVGVTLIVLGVYVVYALARYRGDFRLRSRWMLLFSAARSAYRRLRARFGNGAVVEHEHAHSSTGAYAHHDTEPEDVPSIEGGATAVATATHTHRHAHADPFTDYGTGTSLAVGMLHGVGAETPTQILIFLAAAGAGGAWAGIVVLATFLIGLFVANSIVAVASASGFLAAHGNFRIYAAVSILTAAASLVVGTLLLLGRDAVLPVFFAG